MNYGGEKPLHVTLIPNPSHLEAQDPVACGKTRGKQLRAREGHYGNDPNSHCGDKVGQCNACDLKVMSQWLTYKSEWLTDKFDVFFRVFAYSSMAMRHLLLRYFS